MRSARSNARKPKRKKRPVKKNASSVCRNSVKPSSTETLTTKKSTSVKPSSHTATVSDPMPSKPWRSAKGLPVLLSLARNGRRKLREALWLLLARRATSTNRLPKGRTSKRRKRKSLKTKISPTESRSSTSSKNSNCFLPITPTKSTPPSSCSRKKWPSSTIPLRNSAMPSRSRLPQSGKTATHPARPSEASTRKNKTPRAAKLKRKPRSLSARRRRSFRSRTSLVWVDSQQTYLKL
jgi:hypothetical protein